MQRKQLGSWATVFTVLGALACGGTGGNQATSGPLEVPVVEVAPSDVTVYADFIGTIDGIENAEVRARVPGYLQEVHFQEGAQVKKGDLLFTLDPILSQAALNQATGDVAMARANAEKAKADVARLTPLVATNAVSRQELDHAAAAQSLAEAQMQASEGNRATAQANLDYTKVRSPATGVAGMRKVSVGSLVGQGEPTLLTTVSDLTTMRVRFPISEQLYLKHAIKLNELVDQNGREPARRLTLVLADGSTYPEKGWLALIDRAVSVTTGSILLEARFPNPSAVLRPGQFARIRAATDKLVGALAVPQRAVIERQSMHELFVLGAGDKVERRAVEAGERVGSHWIITKGLKPGDKVIVEGLQKVKVGMVVKPEIVPLGTIGNAPVAPENTAAPATTAPAAPASSR